MSTDASACDAVVRGGQLVLREPLPLPDGTRVIVSVKTPAPSVLLDIADAAVDMDVADGAEQHDHYIYGTPNSTD